MRWPCSTAQVAGAGPCISRKRGQAGTGRDGGLRISLKAHGHVIEVRRLSATVSDHPITPVTPSPPPPSPHPLSPHHHLHPHPVTPLPPPSPPSPVTPSPPPSPHHPITSITPRQPHPSPVSQPCPPGPPSSASLLPHPVTCTAGSLQELFFPGILDCPARNWGWWPGASSGAGLLGGPLGWSGRSRQAYSMCASEPRDRPGRGRCGDGGILEPSWKELLCPGSLGLGMGAEFS